RLPETLLRRREPRAVRDRALQRPASALVLRPDHRRRARALVVVPLPLVPLARPRAAPHAPAHRRRVAADSLGGGAGGVLHAVGWPAAALHPAGAPATRGPGRAHAPVTHPRERSGRQAPPRSRRGGDGE